MPLAASQETRYSKQQGVRRSFAKDYRRLQAIAGNKRCTYRKRYFLLLSTHNYGVSLGISCADHQLSLVLLVCQRFQNQTKERKNY